MEQVGALFGVRQNKTALIVDGKTEVISAEAAVFAKGIAAAVPGSGKPGSIGDGRLFAAAACQAEKNGKYTADEIEYFFHRVSLSPFFRYIIFYHNPPGL